MQAAMNGTVIAGSHRAHLDGTHLEVGHDLQGSDLILRVNKGGVLVFRARLREAVPPILEARLVRVNSLAPDVAFTVGDAEEGITRMMRAAGLEQQMPDRPAGLLRRLL